MPIAGPASPGPFPLSHILNQGLEVKPHDLALVSAFTRWTWQELDQVSNNLALNYLSLGLKGGERVASLMPNRAALLIHYLACMKAGLVTTPLNFRYTPPEIDHALEVSGASILLAHAERAEDLKASTHAHQLRLGFITYGGTLGDSPEFDSFIGQNKESKPLSPPDPKAAAFIFFTSGSTGKPKGVTHSQETFGWMMASLIRELTLTENDILLPGSSISPIGSLLFSLSGLAVGARVDVARTFDGDEILPLLRNTRPTILVMLPAALFTLVRDHHAKRQDFHSLRYCTSEGDKVSAEFERELTDIAGLPIHEGYSMTELCPISMNPVKGLNKHGSVGTVAHNCEISIRDDTGLEVPHGVEGRLWAKSPCKMIGYWENPEATEEVNRDGWLDTGDLMKSDKDGYLWFCGRKKQIIVHDGSNICPQEVEEALLGHSAVGKAGVAGVHHLVHGENVRAYITLTEGAE